MEEYTIYDIAKILNDMSDYAYYANDEDKKAYFDEIVKTGLFHDAIGKVVEKEEIGVIVETNY